MRQAGSDETSPTQLPVQASGTTLGGDRDDATSLLGGTTARLVQGLQGPALEFLEEKAHLWVDEVMQEAILNEASDRGDLSHRPAFTPRHIKDAIATVTARGLAYAPPPRAPKTPRVAVKLALYGASGMIGWGASNYSSSAGMVFFWVGIVTGLFAIVLEEFVLE